VTDQSADNGIQRATDKFLTDAADLLLSVAALPTDQPINAGQFAQLVHVLGNVITDFAAELTSMLNDVETIGAGQREFADTWREFSREIGLTPTEREQTPRGETPTV
jgi:hypothetical protein